MIALKIKVAALFLFLIIAAHLSSDTIDFEKIKISDDVLLQVSISMAVTEDNLFLVVDFKGGDVNIYNSRGEIQKVLGRKGYGPNEFAQPLFCNYSDRKFIISDVGQRKIFIYDRKGTCKFIRSKEIFAFSVGSDLFLKGNKLYVAGNKITGDGIDYEFYSVGLEKNDSYIYFLPGYIKYGLNSESEYKTKVIKKPEISAIGGNAYFDIHGDFAYYLWEGDLKIFKINLKTKSISTFGKKTSTYTKPYASNRLINSFSSRESYKVRLKERSKMSYIKGIFTSHKYVLVIYEARDSSHNDLGYMMQFYTIDGNFIKEIIMPQKPGFAMCYDKKKNILYSITSVPEGDDDESHYILKYTIHENEISK
jgi:hypothetical protein